MHLKASKRPLLSVSVLVTALFGILTITTLVAWLQNFSQLPANMTEESLAKGHLHLFLASQEFWARFPSFGSQLFAYILLPTMLSCVLIHLLVFYLLGWHRKWASRRLAVISMLIGPIYYIAGMIALHGNADFSTCGRWIAVMLLGMLYCLIASAILAMLDLFDIHISGIFCSLQLRKYNHRPQPCC